MLPSPDQNLKIGSVGRFFFFLRTVRELSFPIFFLKFLNGENSGGMQSKRIYKCFFKPLNTNFSKFFAQIWHKKKQKTKKQTWPCFFAFYGRSGEGNITTTTNLPYKTPVHWSWKSYWQWMIQSPKMPFQNCTVSVQILWGCAVP